MLSRGRVPVPPAAAKRLAPLAEEARRRGLPLYAVGGCVRDWLLGHPGFDLDLAVDGDPDDFAAKIAARAAALWNGTCEPFGRFGTWRVIGKDKFRVDVAATRAESYPEPACLPVVGAVGVPIEVDLFRRDFTINALAVRLDDGSQALTDAHGGARDLKARVLRVLHPASFRDDPTRVFRAARFLGRLKCRPAPGLIDAAKVALAAGHAARLSPQRLLHELVSLLGEKDPGPAFKRLSAWGYLALLHLDPPRRLGPPCRFTSVAGVEPRLAALALALGPEAGRDFIDAFPHERRLHALLRETLALAFCDKSPRAVPDPFAAAAVRGARPRLPPAALKSCFLRGEDMIRVGLKPGPSFHELLDEAARLQRCGRLKTRSASLAWLRNLSS